MKEITIAVPDGKKAEWVNGVLTLIDEEVNDNRPVMERIKTFEDACKEIGLSKKLFMPEFDRMAEGFGDALREAAGSMEAEGFNNISAMAEKIIEKGGSLCHM